MFLNLIAFIFKFVTDDGGNTNLQTNIRSVNAKEIDGTGEEPTTFGPAN